eukprot:SAG11_NODE_3265_length_2569_cov_2.457490_3_plen_125_part_00
MQHPETGERTRFRFGFDSNGKKVRISVKEPRAFAKLEIMQRTRISRHVQDGRRAAWVNTSRLTASCDLYVAPTEVILAKPSNEKPFKLPPEGPKDTDPNLAAQKTYQKERDVQLLGEVNLQHEQ